MDYDKFDAMLSMDDPDFANKLRDALGLEKGEAIQIMTPQFTRTDGREVPVPLMDFAKLPSMPEETLKEIGCQRWNEPDAKGDVLWLFPSEWYSYIPDGLEVIDINGETEIFEKGKTDDDIRFGALAYGFMRKAA